MTLAGEKTPERLDMAIGTRTFPPLHFFNHAHGNGFCPAAKESPR